ncbi:Na+/glucose cotransporter [Bacteroides sp. 214]|uniref:sodium:solute symporter n=1 Tax=Bacteroides sp. 214 TaxID=2302935 RepID=UPI0013D18062|nr:sodium:solute symporter [Bacteroides sp. 214]NDW12235.1 Na+/glucose cotransporter [Bacteroides sp. 214]
MNTHYMETLDWGILIIYFVILFAIGIWASSNRKKGSHLFLAGNSLKWPSIGFSMWGTNVGPSMLIASASAGFTTGIVSANFAWYAFVFIFLLAFVFAPRYLGAKVVTLPEFMGKRFGQSTRNILAWYTIVTILISWLALTLFAGGILIKQIFDIPMWQSAILLLLIAAFFTMLGGLKAVAYTNVFQMILLIVVSLTLTLLGLHKVGGVSGLVEAVPQGYWNLFQPNSDPDFPWLPILLGYPVMGVWFWCTDQSMVQPVLAAKNLKQGQLGANFTGWLKILDMPLYILPGVICLALYPTLANPDEAYMTMVTNLFPQGMVGLVMAVLVAALVSTIGSALNALSTVFTMDIYVKRMNPEASQQQIVKMGRVITVVGSVVSILITIAIDSIKGLNLFNVFQSVLGFIAPPMAAVFLFGVFWKKTTVRAANMALTLGTVFSLTVGILYLWVLPADKYDFWPHFMMLSFLLFVAISVTMIVVSLFDRSKKTENTLNFGAIIAPAKQVVLLWALLIVVMIGLYVLFNGH